MQKKEIDGVLQGRVWWYRFLGHVLYDEPSREFMLRLSEMGLAELIASENEGSQKSLLSAAIMEFEQYAECDWQSLKEDHARLFTNSGRILAYPWESVYRNREHVLYDEHTLAVQQFYATWGMQLANQNRGPADHIGLACMFLSELSQRMIEKRDREKRKKCLAAQQEFLQEHILTYAGKFCDLLEKEARTDFYRGLAGFMHVYFQCDEKVLAEILSAEK